jgi:hypothetical protein
MPLLNYAPVINNFGYDTPVISNGQNGSAVVSFRKADNS